ncbi:MAG: lysophospholipid acyltransferase family protein [Thermoanaerobaculia bacterium]
MRWGTAGEEESRSRAGPLRRFLMRRVAPYATLALLRTLDFTWRYRQTGRERFEEALADPRPLVGAFLHGRSFALLPFMSRRENGRWMAMCSKSLDGDAMARVEAALGYEVVRGSSGRDGLQAIVDMIRRVRADPGLGSCLAVDGSRGPRGHVQGGVLSLAQRTGGLLIPVTLSARPALVLRGTWDRTLLPAPFARVDVVFGEAMEVPPKVKGEAFERLRLDLQDRLVALQAEADRLSGHRAAEPVVAP